MTCRPYAKVMDMALRQHGFERRGSDWVRIRGELEETVNIQPSYLGGRTVNLLIKNLETEKIYVRIFASEGAIRMGSISARIGELIDNYDRWWGDEPTGPEEMADLTVRFGLPWFDRFQTLEDQAANWYGRYSTQTRGYHGPSLIGLGLTLYRMGEIDEACAVLSKPVPRTAIKTSVETVARVREWLGCGRADGDASSKS